MTARIRAFGSLLLALVLLAALLWAMYVILRFAWHTLLGVNPNLAVALVAAGATLLGTTITVMAGRYYERRKEIEAHFRSEKIMIYDEFLTAFLETVHAGAQTDSAGLAEFLRQWQRKIVLWAGAPVLASYFKWMGRLKQGNPDARSIFLMDEFFRALRKDIGQSSAGLPRGIFAHILLRRADFFLEQARKSPGITLAELSVLEKQRFGEEG